MSMLNRHESTTADHDDELVGTRHAVATDRDAPARTGYSERVSSSDHAAWNSALRGLAVIAAAVPTVMAVIALIRIDWTAGLDSAPVDVAGVAFTPWVAIGTLVAALVAMIAGGSADRASKVVVGAILACAGLGIVIAGSSRADLDLESAHGWIALAVGAVLVVAGLLMRTGVSVRRDVATSQS